MARCASAGLVTNKPARFTAEILAGLGWTERFDVVVAGDTLPQRKPDPTPLIHAAERVTPVAYVGDSEVDEQAADRAGLRFIAVDWGRSTHPVRVTDLRHIFEVQWSR